MNEFFLNDFQCQLQKRKQLTRVLSKKYTLPVATETYGCSLFTIRKHCSTVLHTAFEEFFFTSASLTSYLSCCEHSMYDHHHPFNPEFLITQPCVRGVRGGEGVKCLWVCLRLGEKLGSRGGEVDPVEAGAKLTLYCTRISLHIYRLYQRVLNDLKWNRLSRGRMIWLLDHPLPSFPLLSSTGGGSQED